HALDAPDFSTAIHEIAHIFEDELSPEERKVITDFSKQKEWNTNTSESFARGFEKYLKEGNAPTSELKTIFEKAKQWLTDIYNKLKSNASIKLTPEVRKVFDSLFKPTEVKKEVPLVSVDNKNGVNLQNEQLVPNRLSPSEEQGAIAGGKRNVEATNLVNSIHNSSSEGEGKQQKLSQEDLRDKESSALEDYAKKNATIEGDGKSIPEKIKNKFSAFKNIKDENITPKEQTTEENVKQSGDKNSAGTNEQKPTKTFKKRAKPTIKNPVYLKALANESEDPNSQVLKYFIGGGRVNRELLKQVMSNRTEELNTKFSLQGTTDENGRPTPKTVDELSHILWNNSSDAIKEKYDSEAFREAIENVVKDHNSRSSMAEELAGQVAPEEKEMHDWYDKTYGGYENEIPEENFNKAIDIAENLPDEQLQKIADTPTETELKVAQSNFDKATKQLKNAEKEFANKQGKQGDLLNPENNISQPDMFANSGQEVRNTLDPLRQKVREASAELEKVQRALGRPHDHLPDLFQVAEPQSEKISQMKGIVKDLQDEGYNKLSDIQNIAAKELGDNSPELKQLVEDAYHEAGKENEPFKKATELQTGLAQRVKSFVGKIFGKDKSSAPVVLKDGNTMMKKVSELQGDGKKVQFSINGENVTGKTVGADVVNGFYSPIEKRIGEFKQENASATKWKEIVGK
ncbi:MAG: hypothetical protein ABI091_15525, partial [Ferruginibacter sp.]